MTRGYSLNATQIHHIQRLSAADLEVFQSKVKNLLIRTKSLQADELASFSYEQVPGDLLAKSQDFFCDMRMNYLGELVKSLGNVKPFNTISTEIAMLQVRKEQNQVRNVIKHEWLMKEEINRDKSHTCLEAALLDREFYTRKQVTQDLKTKQELKISAKCEQAMRNGHEQKKKNKENQFLADLLNHHREFFDFHRKKHVSF